VTNHVNADARPSSALTLQIALTGRLEDVSALSEGAETRERGSHVMVAYKSLALREGKILHRQARGALPLVSYSWTHL
jgi:hypothetical protein